MKSYFKHSLEMLLKIIHHEKANKREVEVIDIMNETINQAKSNSKYVVCIIPFLFNHQINHVM